MMCCTSKGKGTTLTMLWLWKEYGMYIQYGSRWSKEKAGDLSWCCWLVCVGLYSLPLHRYIGLRPHDIANISETCVVRIAGDRKELGEERKGQWLLLWRGHATSFLCSLLLRSPRCIISKLGSPAELELEETASTIFTTLLILCHALGQV